MSAIRTCCGKCWAHELMARFVEGALWEQESQLWKSSVNLGLRHSEPGGTGAAWDVRLLLMTGTLTADFIIPATRSSGGRVTLWCSRLGSRPASKAHRTAVCVQVPGFISTRYPIDTAQRQLCNKVAHVSVIQLPPRNGIQVLDVKRCSAYLASSQPLQHVASRLGFLPPNPPYCFTLQPNHTIAPFYGGPARSWFPRYEQPPDHTIQRPVVGATFWRPESQTGTVPAAPPAAPAWSHPHRPSLSWRP